MNANLQNLVKLAKGFWKNDNFLKVCNDKTMYDRLQTNFDQKMSLK